MYQETNQEREAHCNFLSGAAPLPHISVLCRLLLPSVAWGTASSFGIFDDLMPLARQSNTSSGCVTLRCDLGSRGALCSMARSYCWIDCKGRSTGRGHFKTEDQSSRVVARHSTLPWHHYVSYPCPLIRHNICVVQQPEITHILWLHYRPELASRKRPLSSLNRH